MLWDQEISQLHNIVNGKIAQNLIFIALSQLIILLLATINCNLKFQLLLRQPLPLIK